MREDPLATGALRPQYGGVPLVSSWWMPKRQMLKVGRVGNDVLMMHPYTMERIRLELHYLATLNRLFSAELLDAAGVRH